MAYRLTRTARGHVIDIYLTGVAQFGEAVAERYQDGLERMFAFLSDHPRAARLRSEIDPPVRAHPYKAHLIVYVVDDEDNVLVVGVRHAREDWTSQPLGD